MRCAVGLATTQSNGREDMDRAVEVEAEAKFASEMAEEEEEHESAAEEEAAAEEMSLLLYLFRRSSSQKNREHCDALGLGQT